jgi:hypothetical protein
VKKAIFADTFFESISYSYAPSQKYYAAAKRFISSSCPLWAINAALKNRQSADLPYKSNLTKQTKMLCLM